MTVTTKPYVKFKQNRDVPQLFATAAKGQNITRKTVMIVKNKQYNYKGKK